MRRCLALFGLLALAGCDDNKKPTTATDAAAPDPKAAAIDPKIEKALSAATDGGGGGASDNGPPPGGIFAPGAADARHAKGAPTKIDVALDGSEPRVTLPTKPDDGGAKAPGGGAGKMLVATSMGRGLQMPTLELTLALGVASDASPFVTDVKKVGVAREQRLPEGMEAEIGKLSGSELRFKMGLDGRTEDPSIKLSKNANPDLERMVAGAAEMLMLAGVPSPGKAVGVGAVWMAETRAPWTGLDVILYRAFKVKAIEGDWITISFDAKAYAAGKDVKLAGVPKGATLMQFESAARGELDLHKSDLFAKRMEVMQQTVMVFDAGDAPGQPPAPKGKAGEPQKNVATAQLQTEAQLVREGSRPPPKRAPGPGGPGGPGGP